jgi:hypothetical protein
MQMCCWCLYYFDLSSPFFEKVIDCPIYLNADFKGESFLSLSLLIVNFLFLELSNYPILKDKGKITMLEAKLKAEGEFDKFRIIQDQYYESDFDRMIKALKDV